MLKGSGVTEPQRGPKEARPRHGPAKAARSAVASARPRGRIPRCGGLSTGARWPSSALPNALRIGHKRIPHLAHSLGAVMNEAGQAISRVSAGGTRSADSS